MRGLRLELYVVNTLARRNCKIEMNDPNEGIETFVTGSGASICLAPIEMNDPNEGIETLVARDRKILF